MAPLVDTRPVCELTVLERLRYGSRVGTRKIFEALPNTGVPSAFDSYDSFDRFERTMLERDAIADRGELWYDVRPHSTHGTVEIRAPDGQADPDPVLTFTRYVHALVLDLCERYEDGEEGNHYRRELLDENKWRALRHGHDALLMDQDWNQQCSVRELVEREADRLDLPELWGLYDGESGASSQRRLHREAGVDALCQSLLLEPV